MLMERRAASWCDARGLCINERSKKGALIESLVSCIRCARGQFIPDSAKRYIHIHHIIG
jgi:hypothetical protein